MPNTLKKRADSSKIISLMFMIGRRIRDEMDKKDEVGGKKQKHCSLLHFQTLKYIEDHGRPLMRDVAKYFSITPPAATLLVDGLVRNKFIARVVDKKDRRAVRIALTQKGKKLLAWGVKERLAKLKEVFSVLSGKERSELARILEKVAVHGSR